MSRDFFSHDEPHSLLSSMDWTLETIETLFSLTDALRKAPPDVCRRILRDVPTALLFFEPSTRTLGSFSLAAKRLGSPSFVLPLGYSSVEKGESMVDTLLNMAHMGYRLLVVRLKEEGLLAQCSNQLPKGVALINAGEGALAHPSQALGDLYALRQHRRTLSGLKCAVIGDVMHSRVARSYLDLLPKMGVSDIRLVGPEALIPQSLLGKQIKHYASLEAGLAGADVVLCLRLQKERLAETIDYDARYCFSLAHLALCASDVDVLHPGPIMRGVDVSDEVLLSPHARFFDQVQWGMWVRMAMMVSAMGLSADLLA